MRHLPRVVVAVVAIGIIGYDISLVYHEFFYSTLSLQFQPHTISSITQVSPDTKLFRIKVKTKGEIEACAHVDIKDDSCQIARSYTPISSSSEYLDLLIKRYPNGQVSRLMHSLSPGDIVQMRGPVVTLPYAKNSVETISMIAGGTGITPMYQLIKKVLGDKEDQTKLRLVYANQTKDDIHLKSELDALKLANQDRFDILYKLDNPREGWEGGIGWVCPDDLKELPRDKSVVLVCGPDGFIKSVAGTKEVPQLGGILATLGFKSDQVFKF